MMTTTVVLGLDPLYLVLSVGPKYGIANAFLFLFRGTFIFRLVSELTMAMIAVIIIGIMSICSATDFIMRIAKRKTTLYRLDLEAVRVYRELQIGNGYINQNFCTYVSPPFIFFGVSLIVISTYGTIRMVGKMPWMVYPVIPATAVIAIVVAVTMASKGAKVFENSEKYLRQLSQNARSKYDRRLVKSLRPLDAKLGQFGRVDKGLCTEMVKYFTDYTTNLLITY